MAMDNRSAGMIPTVAIPISVSTIWIFESFLLPICMVLMPCLFWDHCLTRYMP